MNQTANPRRRWFAFSLRTLFVLVTIACIAALWLRMELVAVRERAAVMSWVVWSDDDKPTEWLLDFVLNEDEPAFYRKLLGDQDYSQEFISLKHTERDLARIKTAFPKAIVSIEKYDEWLKRNLPDDSAGVGDK